MATLKELAEKALEQANEMNKLAASNQWEQLETLQSEHTQLVAQITQAPLPTIGQAEIREILISVKTINTDTSLLADEHQKALIVEQKTLKKAEKMQKALDGLE